MSDYSPIACNLHDHVEIACLYRYAVRIATTDGRIVTGTAVDTSTDGGAEFLHLQSGGAGSRVRLDRIVSLEPLAADARFGKIDFAARKGPQSRQDA